MKFNQEVSESVNFILIGQYQLDEYGKTLLKKAASINNVKILGTINRLEISDIFSRIDVLVCPSREDALPIVVTEGMMHGKLCIISSNIGTSEYICDRKNGLVFDSGDSYSLCEKMLWVMKNRESWENIKINARYTFEKYFSMDVFANNFLNIIEKRSRSIDM